MQINRAYSYRLTPDRATAAALRRLCGMSRYIWNKAFKEMQACRKRGTALPCYPTLCTWLTAWRQQEATAFLRQGHSQAQQQVLRDLRDAWDRFFDPALDHAEPCFKKRGDPESMRFPQGFAWDQATGRVKVPKLGYIR